MKQRKVFIGIPVPQAVGKRLAQKVAPWHHLPLRWTKQDNYHVTIAFIGHISDESAADVCERVQEVCETLAPFDILLDQVTLVPEQGKEAEMLWFTGEASENLRVLHDQLSEALGTLSVESKTFVPHITLGRVREKKWLLLSKPPHIDEHLSLSIPADEVVVYESLFESVSPTGGKGRGLVYEPLGAYSLNG